MPELSTSRDRFTVRALANSRAELLIYGDIGDPWDPESPQAAEVVATLAQLDVTHIDLRVNSHGGSVADGLAIISALIRHPATVTGHNDGIAASMGSAILMAADEVVAADASVFMVHAPWGFSMGNATDMRNAAEMLDTFAATLATTYARRVDEATANEWVNGTEDRWFTASEAVDAGLADRVASDAADGALAAAMWNRYGKGAPMKVAAWVRDHQPTGGRDMPKRKPDPAAAAAETETTDAGETVAETEETETTDAGETATETEETETTDAGETVTPVALAAAQAALATRNAEIAAVFAPFRAQAHMAALERFYLTDAAGLQATVDAVRAAVLAKLGEGIEPAGRAQFDAAPAGAPTSSEGASFEQLVQGLVDAGTSRREAIKRVTSEHPAAHLAYLQAANPRRSDVATFARIDA